MYFHIFNTLQPQVFIFYDFFFFSLNAINNILCFNIWNLENNQLGTWHFVRLMGILFLWLYLLNIYFLKNIKLLMIS